MFRILPQPETRLSAHHGEEHKVRLFYKGIKPWTPVRRFVTYEAQTPQLGGGYISQ